MQYRPATLDDLPLIVALQKPLGVQATNRAALRVYLDVGLRIDREFRTYRAPTR